LERNTVTGLLLHLFTFLYKIEIEFISIETATISGITQRVNRNFSHDVEVAERVDDLEARAVVLETLLTVHLNPFLIYFDHAETTSGVKIFHEMGRI